MWARFKEASGVNDHVIGSVHVTGSVHVAGWKRIFVFAHGIAREHQGVDEIAGGWAGGGCGGREGVEALLLVGGGEGDLEKGGFGVEDAGFFAGGVGEGSVGEAGEGGGHLIEAVMIEAAGE